MWCKVRTIATCRKQHTTANLNHNILKGNQHFNKGDMLETS